MGGAARATGGSDYGVRTDQRTATPEERLAMAVVCHAVTTATGGSTVEGGDATTRRRLRAEALAWIESTATTMYSVSSLCDVLGLDADRIRRLVATATGPLPVVPQTGATTATTPTGVGATSELPPWLQELLAAARSTPRSSARIC